MKPSRIVWPACAALAVGVIGGAALHHGATGGFVGLAIIGVIGVALGPMIAQIDRHFG